MSAILAALIAGFIIGRRSNLPPTWKGVLGKISTFSLFALILVMGIQIGANPTVVENLNSLGIQAIIIASFTVSFSVVFLVAFLRLVNKNQKENQKGGKGI